MIFFSVASLFRFGIRITLAMQCCSREWGLHGAGVGSSREEIPHVQGKKQWLHFAGAAVKKYPMSKVRETQLRWYVLQEGIRGQTQ